MNNMPIPFYVLKACTDFETINASNTLGEELYREAVLCTYAVEAGLTLPIFGAAVMLGVFNLPIYIRQESAAIPFVLSLILGGVLLAEVSSIAQAIWVAVILFGIGLGPVLLLHRFGR